MIIIPATKKNVHKSEMGKIGHYIANLEMNIYIWENDDLEIEGISIETKHTYGSLERYFKIEELKKLLKLED